MERFQILKGDGRVIRRALWKRDAGVCARCGLSPAERNTQAGIAPRESRRWNYGDPADWEAHHRVPVMDGGAGCDLDGYETLCVRCHRAETAKQIRAMK